jgi:Flp pilus assembly protein TadB
MSQSVVSDALLQVRNQPALLVWSLLFAIGTVLVLGGLARITGRRSLAERLARLDVSVRFEGRVQADAAFASDGRVVGAIAAVSPRRFVPHTVEHMLRPLVEDAGLFDASALERDLRLVTRGRSIRGFFAEKILAAVAFAAIPPLLTSVGGPATPVVVWLVAGGAGFFVPNWDLNRQLVSRRTRIRMELPAVLDQLAIATSAGLSLEQAISDVALSSEGIVGDEFRRVVAEVEYGRWGTVHEALASLDRCNNVPELTILTSQLQTAHAQGLPVMQVLATQADSFRARKKAALLDAGGKTAVKMVVPIAIFILPVLAIVILVPAVVQLMQIAE